MFGWLPYLSVTKNIDFDIVFQYLLLPEPPCLAHRDGSLCETNKLSVIHFLKNKKRKKNNKDYSSPSNVNTGIEDVMFVVRSSLKEKSSNFSSFTKIYFDQAVTTYQLLLRFMVSYLSISINMGHQKESWGDRDLENMYNFI